MFVLHNIKFSWSCYCENSYSWIHTIEIWKTFEVYNSFTSKSLKLVFMSLTVMVLNILIQIDWFIDWLIDWLRLTAVYFEILWDTAGLDAQFLHHILWDSCGGHLHLVLVDEEIPPRGVQPFTVLIHQDALGVIVSLLTDLVIFLNFILSKDKICTNING